MAKLQFARYPEEPIACEGDDKNAELILVEMEFCLEKIAAMTIQLMSELGGYIQFWDRGHE